MKNILAFILILSPILAFSQDIKIDLNNPIKSVEKIVDRGKHTLEINAAEKIIGYKIERGVVELPRLNNNDSLANNNLIDNQDKSKIQNNLITEDLLFKSNTIYTVTIEIKDEPIPRKFIFKSVSIWDWTTTFGANSVFIINNNSYKTVKKGTDSYIVTEFNSTKKIEYIPSLMFTFMNRSDNVSFGFTGGIGFDTEQISVFSGISLGIGQNIILTGGMALHKQEELNSTYSIGQEVNTPLTAENLITKQYRFNPFIGISFRMNKNSIK